MSREKKLCENIEELDFKDFVDSKDPENEKLEQNRDVVFPGLNYDVWGDKQIKDLKEKPGSYTLQPKLCNYN